MIQSAALWTWNVSGSVPAATGYPPNNIATKTGLQPQDLQDFVGVPLQYYHTTPVTPMQPTLLYKIIRWAEDWVESETSLLLAQSWIASPPAVTPQAAQAANILPTASGGWQQLGVDYDIEDAGYDFFFPRAQDEGWMIYSLRYRPIRNVLYGPSPLGQATALKNISYQYPLLNEFFNVPLTWAVEDHDFGLVRLVPAANVQMLPLFAMQLSFMGFAESVPGAIWFQYTAGLTANDYNSRWSFIKQLVLAQAAVVALTACQGTVNLGVEQTQLNIDGALYSAKYPVRGPFAPIIDGFEKQREALLGTARDRVSGPMITTL